MYLFFTVFWVVEWKRHGKKKLVSGMDITKQLREAEIKRLFWNRKHQKTRLHESGPERRNPPYSLEKHPGSGIPDKGF
jgi:hypothetical protein